MDYVPRLVDAVGGVAKTPLSNMYGTAMDNFDGFVQARENQLYGSRAYQYLNRNVFF